MAERRMFAKTIIDSDAFLDMPLSTQALYFHLNMRADDEGFINNPKKIQRMIGASDDDLKLLIAKSFVIPFDSGIVVIKHWRINNYLQNDRCKKTVYQEERSLLTLKENNAYTLANEPCIQNVYRSDTQNSIDKNSIDQISINNNSTTNVVDRSTSDGDDSPIEQVRKAWNELIDVGINQIRAIAEGSTRAKMLKARINQYGIDSVIEAIGNIRKSSFLLGSSKNGWSITFDWFIRPNNFPKVLEGNYTDKNFSIGNQSSTQNGSVPEKPIQTVETEISDEEWEAGGDDA